MINLNSKIKKLKNLTATVVNETQLLEEGESLMKELRQAWPKQKDNFSTDDIKLLQTIKCKIEGVRSFIDTQEGFEYIATSDDAHVLINELAILVDLFKGMAVQGRVEKEIREMCEKANNLPSSKDRKESSELNSTILKLSSQAPTRNKCGDKMVIREGNGKYFWSCQHFPRCWGKRGLNKKEIKSIQTT